MRNKRFPNYPDDSDYNTNAPSYYDDLARKTKLIEVLSKKVWDYDKELGKRFDEWDKNLEKFPDNVKTMLQGWLDDDKLDQIINDTIFNWKVDQTEFDTFKDSTTAQLVQTPSVVNVENFKTAKNTWADAFENAVEFATTNFYKTIKLPRNTDLLIDRPLTIGGTLSHFDLIIEGDGKGIDERGSCLTYTGKGTMLTIDLQQPVVGQWRGITFKNMSFRTTDKEVDGVKLVFTQQALFENVEFIGWNNAVVLTGNSHYPLFRHCKFLLSNKGIFVPEPYHAPFVDGGVNHGKLENCFFTYCENPLYILSYGTGWVIDNTDFEGFNGTIILGFENKMSNVRIERNNHLQPWIEVLDNNNLDIGIGVSGGLIPYPTIKAGKKNNITVGGGVMALIDPNTFGKYNTLNLDTLEIFNPNPNFPFIYRLDKTNKIEFNGVEDNTNLLNSNLTTWNKSSDVTITESTFSDGTLAYKIVNGGTVEGVEGDVSFQINKTFEVNEKLYISLDREVLAGAIFKLQVGNTVYSITDIFSSPMDKTKSVVGFEFSSPVINPLIHIYIAGGRSAIKIGNLVGNSYLSSGLFK